MRALGSGNNSYNWIELLPAILLVLAFEIELTAVIYVLVYSGSYLAGIVILSIFAIFSALELAAV